MTTSRQIFEGLLTELSKVNAPSLSLNEFNYYFNKAILLYVNKRYNVYDLNLQITDDVRVLKSTANLTPKAVTSNETNTSIANLYKATYEVDLPIDYLHLLNCICIFELKKDWHCYNKGNLIQIPATRLTSDSWSKIVNDWYNRPTPERPYYFIHNVNSSNTYPYNPRTITNSEYTGGTDMQSIYKVTSNGYNSEGEGGYNDTVTGLISNADRTLKLGENSTFTLSNVEKATAFRPVNPSIVRCEIRYGRDNSVFELAKVQVDYIKTPQYIRLTQELMDTTEDFSQIMEFPDNVCQEITNELVHLVMERVGDQRLGTHFLVSLSVALPGQQQAQPQALAAQ